MKVLNTRPSDELNPAALEQAIKKTQYFLLRSQNEKGYWVGKLEADASVAAGYIPLMYYMTGHVKPQEKTKIITYIKNRQNSDGSWSSYFSGPGDLNVSVQVYFALKLAGLMVSDPLMARAKNFILSQGGLSRTNTITKIWLALFGQFDYRGTPAIPPELVLLPDWFYFNIYEFASWSRETIMALILILSRRPVCRIPAGAGITELYVEVEEKRRFARPAAGRRFGWPRIFILLDSVFKIIDRLPVNPLRRLAERRVEKWVVDHQEPDGSWGGIMLPWIYALIALKALGYGLDHPVIKRGMDGLVPFLVADESTLWLQPATSPVWDTAWSILALRESGIAESHSALTAAARWLLQRQISAPGDWQIKNPHTPPGAWSFEFTNNFYPDIDDAAVVSRALLAVKLDPAAESPKLAAVERGLRWVQDMQSANGGWAAFDRDNNKQFLAGVPFTDFITPLDPTSPDVTAHAIDLISQVDRRSRSLARSVEYLKSTQEPDGAWYGRWGVNYIYGTGLSLVSLVAAGENPNSAYLLKAVSWLVTHQNADGGWGESCDTYANPARRGQGLSTASQTAWALLGLIAAGRASSLPAARGIHYLLEKQNEDGTWTEESYTGTGFPRAFYLHYDLYRIYFPLLALGHYYAARDEKK
jgi:squalene-hopene/tetraprenyl-beta-curcumene cyclase